MEERFNHYKVEDMVDDMMLIIYNNNLSPKVNKKLMEITYSFMRSSIFIKHVDLLLSNECNEDEFFENIGNDTAMMHQEFKRFITEIETNNILKSTL